MGALHEGHLSLIRQARTDCDIVVVSIFVNPTQFAPAEDLATYPRDIAADTDKCHHAGVDLVFVPSDETMYTSDFNTWVEVKHLTEKWEGAVRWGHFKGVTTVVLKLVNIVAPDKAYFGMKDYQQLKVIQKMVRDLDVPVEIVPMPTVREPGGLAMSSRNAYLSPEERSAATILHRALLHAGDLIRKGERNGPRIRDLVEEFIHREPLAKADYVAVVDPETLDPAASISGSVVVLLAVRIGTTRLIDNMSVTVQQ
jgi:pantoate--beta-alanine ligase